MAEELSSFVVDKRRYVLASVLAVIALVLVIGGVKLLTLGGSAYYLLAGLAVGGSAYLVSRGDRRGVWLYGLMLAATVLWAFLERGTNIWGFTARVVAPAVLGLWVFWPVIRSRAKIAVPVIAASAIGFFAMGAADLSPDPALPHETSAGTPVADREDWRFYGNDQSGTRFATVSQITPENVGELESAWTYRTGSERIGLGFQVTPLMIEDTLYLCTSDNIIHALEPDTGKKKWVYDPKAEMPTSAACRGVAYHEASEEDALCARRIIFATGDARLMAVDAATGTLCSDFGDAGTVDLKRGMGEIKYGYYYISSPPTIVNGNVVLGGWVTDGQYVGEPSGVIRAYNAVTGDFAWAWDMDRPGEYGEPAEGETYSRGTPNSWAPMSGDDELGLVYLPVGNATPDYWLEHRSEASNTYASSVVALDSRTGEPRWHFQTLHKDVWDYDVASQPTLIDLKVNGKVQPALIQPTKRGEIFVLNRETGEPIFPVEERPVLHDGVIKGLAKTQPFSAKLPIFDDTVWTEDQMWGATPLDQLWCRIKFKEARYDGALTPPMADRPTITYPSYLGGMNWGSVSVDPERALMTVNYNRMANHTKLVARKEAEAMGVGLAEDGAAHAGVPVAQLGTPYAVATGPFLSVIGMPCTEPPYGGIAVVDLNEGRTMWERPLGTAADSGPAGISSRLPIPMGVPNTGGSLTTRSGLIFIGATQEKAFRAFDLMTGKKLWSTRIPTSAHATPMTFVSPKTGKQYVIIVAGGSNALMTAPGDHVLAFTLP